MLSPRKFHIPPGHDAKRWIGELTDRYSVQEGRIRVEKISFYDTFDWRLFHRSLVLYVTGNKLFLRKLFEPGILHSAIVASPPVFASDLPDSELKKGLAPIVNVRALRKLADIYSWKTPYRILGRRKNPVARLVHEEIRPSREKDAPVLAACLWWKPGKESSRSSRNLGKRLEEAGFTPIRKEDIYVKALKAAGKKPGDYSSKVTIPLRSDMRSDEAMKTILRFLLRVIRINEPHIEKDLDTEFLHDLRVAIRRTRSALRRMKKVFPLEITARFRKDLSYVGKITNELRDLDVYLLNEEQYKAMLPAPQSADIDPLFDHLREKRSRAFQDVIRNLASEKYSNILDGWEVFLKESHYVSSDASDADLPVRDLARKKIYRKYRRIVKDGNLILENTEDEMLHALRIHCKELRYLLEFFTSLFPRKEIHGFIRQLKKLQDMLGDFNDFCVQEQYLAEVSGELCATGQQTERTVAAIGVLIEMLDREKQKVRDAFSKTFTEYASPANKRAFREVFAFKESAPIDNREGKTL
jgi:CHAD domain-containing protein